MDDETKPKQKGNMNVKHVHTDSVATNDLISEYWNKHILKYETKHKLLIT